MNLLPREPLPLLAWPPGLGPLAEQPLGAHELRQPVLAVC